MPSIVRLNVRKTLIAYMTTSFRDRALRVDEGHERGDAHQPDPVVRDEAVGELGEAVGRPGVRRHVGQDARPVEEARLRRDEEEAAGRDQGERSTRVCPRAKPPIVHDPKTLSARTAFMIFVGCGRAPVSRYAEDDARRGEGERDRHVEHRLLRVVDLRLPQDRHAVGNGLDAGVRAAAQRVGAQDDEEHRQEPDRGGRCPRLCDGRRRRRRAAPRRGCASAKRIIRKCVAMKSRKIGTRTVTLSLTPRRFRTTRSQRTTSFDVKA